MKRPFSGNSSIFSSSLLSSPVFSADSLSGATTPAYGQVPLTFIANRGQVHPSVRFTAQAADMTAYFTPEEVVVDLRGRIVRLRYPGANPSPQVDGLDAQEGRAHYFIGSDPDKWTTNVPLFGRIVYRDLYPGIDMIYSARARQLKSEFVVAAGADASRIQIAYTGADSLRLGEDGALIVLTPEGKLREGAPAIYQEGSAGRTPVSGGYLISGSVVSFQVGDYDHSRALWIDPLLSYSTYLNGSGVTRANAIAVDSAGEAYVTGFTDSANFPSEQRVGARRVWWQRGCVRHQTQLGGNGNRVQRVFGRRRGRSRIFDRGGRVAKRLCHRLDRLTQFSGFVRHSNHASGNQERICS